MRRRYLRALVVVLFALSALPAEAGHAAVHTDFDPGNFSPSKSTRIDNKFYPLSPGTELILEGQSLVDIELIGSVLLPRRLVVTVTDVTKMINGVRALAILERDYNDVRPPGCEGPPNTCPPPNWQLAEDELAFLSQDKKGNVWRLAEFPDEYDVSFEPPLPVGAPKTWVSGQDGSEPGVYMRRNPKPGTSPYSLVFAPNVEVDPDVGAFGIDDQGTVVMRNQTICVPAGCFDNAVVVEEQNVLSMDDPTTPLVTETDCCQWKYHVPGVGNVKAIPAPGTGDTTQELLELIEVRKISKAELEAARVDALALDEKAYGDPDGGAVWGFTPRAERKTKKNKFA